jgi:hypothetical protein
LSLSRKPETNFGIFQKVKMLLPLNILLNWRFISFSVSKKLIVVAVLQAKFLLSPFLTIQSRASSKIH